MTTSPGGVEAHDDKTARERIVRLFQFVAAYHEQRYPATRQLSEHEWALQFADVPDHETIVLKRHVFESAQSAEEPSSDAAPASEGSVLLSVQRPSRSEPPEAPDALRDWLGSDWQNCSSTPTPVDRRLERNDDGNSVIVQFDEDSERIAALAGYSDLWNEWAARERIAAAAGDVFEQLYQLHGILSRDGERYELVVADGLLVWGRQDGGVRHPLLSRGVRLEFDPQIPEFRVMETGAATEFYASLFRSMPDVGGDAIGKVRSELEALDPHPLGAAETNGALRAIAMALSSQGRFVDDESPGPERPYPVLARQPMFILRKRTSGMARAIDRVVEDALNGGELSRALQNVVGIASDGVEIEPLAESGPPTPSGAGVLDENTEDSVLFTKFANAEQIQIAHRLNRESCVLVQGPPGTGKTHTIANLVGHLLAEGKSVLVTSHTTKALKVLREKVVPKLQPLCLSVLDSAEDDDNLKSAIGGIVHRLGSADGVKLDREIESLRRKRAELVEEIGLLRSAVLDARYSEYRPIVIDGAAISPIDAAKENAAKRSLCDWIPSPVGLEAQMPLSASEFFELYDTNESVTADEEEHLRTSLPDVSDFPSPAEFRDLVAERHAIPVDALKERLDLWHAKHDLEIERLEGLVDRANEALESITRLQAWVRPIACAGSNDADRQPWLSLLAEVDAVHELALGSSEVRLTHQPRLATAIQPDRAAEVYESIAADVRRTRRAPSFLTLFSKPEWKRAIEGAHVGAGARPRLPEHFEALAASARLSERREALRRRWQLQVESIGGPSARSLGEDVEDSARAFTVLIGTALDWWSSVLSRVADEAAEAGFAWSAACTEADAVFADHDAIERVERLIKELLTPAAASERNRRLWKRIDGTLQALLVASTSWAASTHASALRRSLETLEADAYREAYEAVAHLSAQTRRVQIRSAMLATLEAVAPTWAAEIRGRIGIHGKRQLPGDAAAAWRWRQIEDELDRRSSVSLPELLRKLDNRRVVLREVTADLVDALAWKAQLGRTSLAQRQALMGFAAAKKRIGKGTGKRAATLAKMARDLMTEARTAVPVWIMPIVKVAEVFDPSTTRFDVVIVDESSQCEVTGLLAAYLGRQVVVVGDDEQVSPSAVGEKVIDSQNLIDAYLQGIPNNQLYDGRQSLYDIAKQSFGGALSLLEHFRCVPDIIRFSNALSYNGSIRPLREVLPIDPTPAVVSHRVASVGVSGKVNEDEAIEVASLVAAALEQPEYDGKTFGIISMVGDEQAYRIETLLRMVVPPTEIERRRLLAGSAAQFQGDERNVMFLSMVDVGDGTPLRMDRETKTFQQRFNVAASRSQDQMWVVYSLDPATELKSGDIRRRLIEHALDPSALARREAEAASRAESPFEREVIERLTAAGYYLTTQHPVGSYRIDIVVTGADGRRLAVECDGERYHRIEDLERDVERQMVLERLGWRFVRIRGSSFYRDRNAALQPVYERLREMGIAPLDYRPESAPPPAASDLVERVRSRAIAVREQIRALRDRIATGPRRDRAWRRELRIVS